MRVRRRACAGGDGPGVSESCASPVSAEQRHRAAETLILRVHLPICQRGDWEKEERGKKRGVDKTLVRKKIGLAVPFRP